jgi:hypothetical protein
LLVSRATELLTKSGKWIEPNIFSPNVTPNTETIVGSRAASCFGVSITNEFYIFGGLGSDNTEQCPRNDFWKRSASGIWSFLGGHQSCAATVGNSSWPGGKANASFYFDQTLLEFFIYGGETKSDCS